MRTRNADNPKSGTPSKKTPPGRKAAAKTPTPPSKPATTAESMPEAETPNSSVVNRTPSKANSPDLGTAPAVTSSRESKPEIADEQAKVSAEDAPSTKHGEVTPPGSSSQAAPTTKKVTRRVVKKKVVKKTPVSAKAEPAATPKQAEPDNVKPKVEEQFKEEEVDGTNDDVSPMNVEVVAKGVDSGMQDERADKKVGDMGKAPTKGKTELNVDELSEVDPINRFKGASDVAEAVEKEPKSQEVIKEKVESHKEGGKENVDPHKEKMEENVDPHKVEGEENVEPDKVEGEENVEVHKGEEEEKVEVKEDYEIVSKQDDMEQDHNDAGEHDGAHPNDDVGKPVEEMVEYGEEEGFVEPGDEELQEDAGLDAGEECKTSEEERAELTAAANERKLKKELEVFVGGLDRDVVEEDLKKAYEKVGEVTEVRLLKDPSTNRNRGFAFVRFAAKEQASRALSEMKNPVIRGKRCGTAPSEDNDVLFLGNICNTWTKEAIKQKLKDYGVEGVEYITLVQDPRHEGLSRGFCFIQFACHADATHAYKRLQKPDAVFGHAERTAKVAFGEPLREPDPDVMAKVKSVFVDGLPPHWDEDHVRENFKGYGEIEKVTLARNMSSAKRKDFGFVDFTTHEAAVACIDDVNSRELTDGNSKAKVRARLSNPLPKTQAVKGGMCGGFRIGCPGGRSFNRGGRPFNQPNFQYGRGRGRGRGFNQHGRGQYDPVVPYPEFNHRRPFGQAARRTPFHGGHQMFGGSVSSRPFPGGARHGRPAPPEEGYPIYNAGRHFDEPYPYVDRAPGVKRPFSMMDQDPTYMEPSRLRPRFDYNDPAHGSRYRDSFGASNSSYSRGYYGSDYGGGPYSSYRGGGGGGSYGSGSYGGGSYGGASYGGASYGGGPYY